MRLESLNVRDFRCIDDLGELTLKQVTCLVGKNESGKTAILSALHKLKPVDELKEKFVPSRDYPKRRWFPNMEIPADADVITTVWELSDEDVASLEATYGKGFLTSRTVKVSKGYSNRRKFVFSHNEEKVCDHYVTKSGLASTSIPKGTDIKSLEGLRAYLETVEEKTDNHTMLGTLLIGSDDDGIVDKISSSIDHLMPTFLYFDQYLRLPGAVSIDQLLTRKGTNTLTDEDDITMALVELAGTSLDTIHKADTFDVFNASLRAVSVHISEQIFKYWKQNKHLQVHVRVDAGKPKDPAPFNTGQILRTQIDNTRHRADTSFDDRSTGFVWFFSFLIWFNKLRNEKKKDLLILLDEPGLSLHARAQKDLLEYFNKELAPIYQVLYTTHSPFMIDPDNLLNCRTVEDIVLIDKKTKEEKLLGTKIGDKVLSTDPDTISPLQRVLDYEITQTLFIGRNNLLVEGPSDILYIKWFSAQLERKGKVGLDYRWIICVVGGVDRIPGFVSLFRGNNLNVAALVDIKQGDNQKIDNAKKSLPAGHVFTTSDFIVGQKESDIEDVLGYDFFSTLVNKTYDLPSSQKLPFTKPTDAPERNAKFAEDHFRVLPSHLPEFDHFDPSEYLFKKQDEGASFPGYDEAMANFEKLILAFNKLL